MSKVKEILSIPDNTKTAVKIPDLVDSLLNTSYTEMARHYGTTLVPARSKKPKDKAADEHGREYIQAHYCSSSESPVF